MPSLLLNFLPLLIIVATSLCSANTFAKQSNLIIDVVAEEFYPFQYQEGGKAKGTAVEIIKQVLADTNLTANIQFYPWSRALRIAESAPNTMILSITRNSKREDKFYWIGLIQRHELYLWVNKNHWKNQSFTVKELQTLTIGVPRDGHQYQFLSSHPLFSDNPFSVVNTKEQAISMLAMNRIDAISGDPKLLRSRMSRIGLSPDLFKPIKHFPDKDTELFIAMSKNSNPELVQGIKQKYLKFSATEQFQQLIKNY